jgi:hypothetical protein
LHTHRHSNGRNSFFSRQHSNTQEVCTTRSQSEVETNVIRKSIGGARTSTYTAFWRIPNQGMWAATKSVDDTANLFPLHGLHEGVVVELLSQSNHTWGAIQNAPAHSRSPIWISRKPLLVYGRSIWGTPIWGIGPDAKPLLLRGSSNGEAGTTAISIRREGPGAGAEQGHWRWR